MPGRRGPVVTYSTLIRALRAISSAGERCLHTAEVEGSKPPSPTVKVLVRGSGRSYFEEFLPEPAGLGREKGAKSFLACAGRGTGARPDASLGSPLFRPRPIGGRRCWAWMAAQPRTLTFRQCLASASSATRRSSAISRRSRSWASSNSATRSVASSRRSAWAPGESMARDRRLSSSYRRSIFIFMLSTTRWAQATVYSGWRDLPMSRCETDRHTA